MPHQFNANFRNLHDGTLQSQKFKPEHGYAGVPLTLGNFDPILHFACGETTSADLTQHSHKAVYRASNEVWNSAYYARSGNFQMDDPNPLEITCTASGFTPIVTLVRSVDHRWTSDSGVIIVEITPELTGPFIIEISSVEPHATGHFDLHIACVGACAAVEGTTSFQISSTDPAMDYWKIWGDAATDSKGFVFNMDLNKGEDIALGLFSDLTVQWHWLIEVTVVAYDNDTGVVTIAPMNWDDNIIDDSWYLDYMVLSGATAGDGGSIGLNTATTIELDDGLELVAGDVVALYFATEGNWMLEDVDNEVRLERFIDLPVTARYKLIAGSYNPPAPAGDPYLVQVVVDCTPPKADFTVDSITPCADGGGPFTVVVTNHSTGASAWHWSCSLSGVPTLWTSEEEHPVPFVVHGNPRGFGGVGGNDPIIILSLNDGITSDFGYLSPAQPVLTSVTLPWSYSDADPVLVTGDLGQSFTTNAWSSDFTVNYGFSIAATYVGGIFDRIWWPLTLSIGASTGSFIGSAVYEKDSGQCDGPAGTWHKTAASGVGYDWPETIVTTAV